MKKLLILTLALGTAACSRDVAVMSAPNMNVYSSYTAKVPGKWALYVNDNSLRTDVHTDGVSCSAYSWPLDLSASFKQSVAATFRNLVDDVEIVDQPVAAQSLAAGGYAGVIRVNGDDLRVHLTMVPGFWENTAEVSTEIDAGIVVEGAANRLLGTQATGTGRQNGGAGAFCDGNSVTIERSTETAMRGVVGQLAERFSNAPQIRQASVGAVPASGGYSVRSLSASTSPSPSKPAFGITGSTITGFESGSVGMKERYGVYVDSVANGSVAAQIGLQRGDIIQGFDGHRTASFADLSEVLGRITPGTSVKIDFWRDKGAKSVTWVIPGSL